MKVIFLSRFEREYKKLPKHIKTIAEERFEIFLKNPFNHRLKTHKLSGIFDGYYAFSIDHSYRIIFEFTRDGDVRFYRVGDHNIYD